MSARGYPISDTMVGANMTSHHWVCWWDYASGWGPWLIQEGYGAGGHGVVQHSLPDSVFSSCLHVFPILNTFPNILTCPLSSFCAFHSLSHPTSRSWIVWWLQSQDSTRSIDRICSRKRAIWPSCQGVRKRWASWQWSQNSFLSTFTISMSPREAFALKCQSYDANIWLDKG